jgi:hypothetical protein
MDYESFKAKKKILQDAFFERKAAVYEQLKT